MVGNHWNFLHGGICHLATHVVDANPGSTQQLKGWQHPKQPETITFRVDHAPLLNQGCINPGLLSGKLTWELKATIFL